MLCVKAILQEAIFSSNLQRNGVLYCKFQNKSPLVTLLICKNNYIAGGHRTICMCLKSYRNMQYLSPKIARNNLTAS